MKKTFKVVMLSSDNEVYPHLILTTGSDKLMKYNGDYGLLNKEIYVNQHLYIISDEDIKEGDWCIDSYNQIHQFVDLKFAGLGSAKFSKIVATTDISIGTNGANVRMSMPLPQLPESFIQAYIKAYNESKPITEVDLEIESKRVYNDPDIRKADFEYKDIIKTRPDNTVIVHQSKL